METKHLDIHLFRDIFSNISPPLVPYVQQLKRIYATSLYYTIALLFFFLTESTLVGARGRQPKHKQGQKTHEHNRKWQYVARKHHASAHKQGETEDAVAGAGIFPTYAHSLLVLDQPFASVLKRKQIIW